MVALKMSKERIRQIDSYLKRKSRDKNLFIVDAKKALKTSEHTISKRLNALNIMSTGQDTKVLENTITELNKWLKENSFTVQGKKYFDNEEFEKIMPKLERIMEVEEVTTHTDVFYKLLEFYENNKLNKT